MKALAGLLVLVLGVPAQRVVHRPHRGVRSSVAVLAHEYRLTLSRAAVVRGLLTLEYDNEGQDAHDLRLAGSDGHPQLLLPPVKSATRLVRTVRLRPGVYRLWCSLPGHDAAGMHAQLRVR